MKRVCKYLGRILSLLILLPIFFGFLSVEEKYQEKATFSQGFLGETMEILDKVGVIFNVTSIQSQVVGLQGALERFEDGTVTVLEFYEFTEEISLVYGNIMTTMTPIMERLNSLADWGDALGSSSVRDMSNQYRAFVMELEETQLALENYVLYTEILLGVLVVSAVLGLCGLTFFPVAASIGTLVYSTLIGDFFYQLLEETAFTVHIVVYASVGAGVLAFVCGLIGMKKPKSKEFVQVLSE